MIGLGAGRIEHVLALGAHCDDIAIGAGGTLLTIGTRNPAVRVDALVLAGGGTARETEERAALAAFLPHAKLELTAGKLPDGRFPAYWDEAKQLLEDLRLRCDPQLVLAPWRGDAHQDHRGLAELVPTVFRDHLVLGYEIAKWDGDLAVPGTYQPLRPELAARKADLLYEHYPSQRHRSWFDREAFLGLARLRGIECGTRYAEAFHTDKLVLDLEG